MNCPICQSPMQPLNKAYYIGDGYSCEILGNEGFFEHFAIYYDEFCWRILMPDNSEMNNDNKFYVIRLAQNNNLIYLENEISFQDAPQYLIKLSKLKAFL